MDAKKYINNPFWGAGEAKNFGKIAIEYAAGEDVVLDQQLVQYECLTNQVHVIMLLKQGLIDVGVAKKILKGLKEIISLDKQGKFKLRAELEDVHSNVEQYLIDKYGIEIGGYLRLGIARNDQVYTDTRMWIKDKILFLGQELIQLIGKLLIKAEFYVETVMPGYTHLRISQSITYGHWLMSKAYHFIDDLDDLLQFLEFVDQCPLGIFEMAGTSLPIDRKLTARLLGFRKNTTNSLYTANLRGELEAKFLSILSILALHIRRTMTEVIMFSSHEFQLLKIDDLYTTGGTAQPNLKNPDTLEVVRANMAKMLSSLVETLMIMDPLPSGFNRDTQQTKPVLFSATNVMVKTLPVFTGIITTLLPNREEMERVANLNFATAPDLTVQLCIKGKISFREAYKVVKTLIKQGYLKHSFTELTPAMIAEVALKTLKKKIVMTQTDINEVAKAKECAFSHTSDGGPAPSQVKKQIHSVTKIIGKIEKRLNSMKDKQKKMIIALMAKVNKLVGE